MSNEPSPAEPSYPILTRRLENLEEERKAFITSANAVAGTENFAWTAAMSLISGKLQKLEDIKEASPPDNKKFYQWVRDAAGDSREEKLVEKAITWMQYAEGVIREHKACKPYFDSNVEVMQKRIDELEAELAKYKKED